MARLRAAPGAALLKLRQPAERRRYRRGLRDFHRALVRPGDLVFDVGANVGDYTEAFLSLGAEVVALDPDPEAVAALEGRFGRDSRVSIVDKGVADRKGSQQLYETDGGSPLTTMSPEWVSVMRSSGRFDHLEWHPTGTVEVTTLDALIAERGVPGFVKVDVEGFELQVIRGLSRPVRGLSLETYPEHRERTIEAARHLSQLGEAEFAYAPGAPVHRIGKSMPGQPEAWAGLEQLDERLRRLRKDDFGDVLIRFARST